MDRCAGVCLFVCVPLLSLTDKTIKFWEWAVITEQQQQPGGGDDDPAAHPAKKQKKKHKKQDDGEDQAAAAGRVVQRLGFQLTRQLEMAEDVLCVKVCRWVLSTVAGLLFLVVMFVTPHRHTLHLLMSIACCLGCARLQL